MIRKLNNVEFIERAKEVHGNKYDYSLVKYINSKTKVKIICPIHGIFEQSASKHINVQSGCPKCNGGVKLTNDEFIIKANIKHNNKYIYLDEYLNSSTKMNIICPIHGIFSQTPNSHLQGYGCSECSKNNRFMNISDFKKKSNKIHSNKYNYEKVKYVNSKIKVKIICPEHGIFEQKPNDHLMGRGCMKCSDEKNRLLLSDIIKKANKIHDSKYDYSLINYINNKSKVKIICPEHGVFEQSINNHINKKNGCPKCKYSKGEKKIFNILFNNENFIQQYKINDCKDKKELPFDFYLPDYNLCIEYDGEQHFKSINYFGGKEKYLQTQKHDQIKNQYCKDNDIDLLRISYKDILNIEEIINEKITKLKCKMDLV